MPPNCRPPSGSRLGPASGAPAPIVIAGGALHFNPFPCGGSLQNRRSPVAPVGLHSMSRPEVSAPATERRASEGVWWRLTPLWG